MQPAQQPASLLQREGSARQALQAAESGLSPRELRQQRSSATLTSAAEAAAVPAAEAGASPSGPRPQRLDMRPEARPAARSASVEPEDGKLLCLLRHGQGKHNPRADLRFLYHLAMVRDPELTALGVQQAALEPLSPQP